MDLAARFGSRDPAVRGLKEHIRIHVGLVRPDDGAALHRDEREVRWVPQRFEHAVEPPDPWFKIEGCVRAVLEVQFDGEPGEDPDSGNSWVHGAIWAS